MELPKTNSDIKCKWKKLPKGQMILDAGQKRFGITECPKCKLVFHMGYPNEEIFHHNYHNGINIFKYNGWKNERVVVQIHNNAKIIKIVYQDSKLWWKKVNEVIRMIDTELGIYEKSFEDKSAQVYFYIENKCIRGCLIAVPKTTAHRMLSDKTIDTCTVNSYTIKCGVSRIWVNKNCRKLGIATALMDYLKRSFYPHYILNNDDIGFSSPTTEGRSFAVKYFKNENFLVYIN